MTGFESKRQSAQDKLDDEADTLTIVYQQGFADGKRSAQRTWVGLTDEEVELYWDWEDFQIGAGRSTIFKMVRDIEAKLKERNT